MLRRLKEKKAQAMVVEYSITFLLVFAFLTSMAVYIRRTLQARAHGAHEYMANQMRNLLADESQNWQGNYYSQYEPYYAEVRTTKRIDQYVVDRLSQGVVSGISKKEIIKELANSQVLSTQFSPQNAD